MSNKQYEPSKYQNEYSIKVSPPRNNNLASKAPALINYIYPSEKEQYMEMAPKNKLSNIMFMSDNPFDNAGGFVQRDQQQSTYKAENYLEKSTIKNNIDPNLQNKQGQTNENLHKELHQGQLQVQKQAQASTAAHIQPNVQCSKCNTTCSQGHCCCQEHPHYCYYVMQPNPDNELRRQSPEQQSGKDKSNLPKFSTPPIRHTKPGSGHYNYTPTGFRFMKPAPPREEYNSSQTKQQKTIKVSLSEEKKTSVERGVQTLKMNEPIIHKKQDFQTQTLIIPQNKFSSDDQLTFQIEVVDFKAKNEQAAQQMQSLKGQNIFFDYKMGSHEKRFFVKAQNGNTLKIEDNQSVSITTQQLLDEEIIFSMQCFRLPQNSQDQKHYMMTLGTGKVQLNKLFGMQHMNTEFIIPIMSRLPQVQSINEQHHGFVKINKEKLEKASVIEWVIGELRIKASVSKTVSKEIIIQTSDIQMIYSAQNPSLYISFTQFQSQLETHLGIYLRYKVQGTKDSIQTQTIAPDGVSFDHSFVYPINFASLLKMQQSPFIVELWQQREKPQLIGIIKFDLSSIPNIILLGDDLDISGLNINVFEHSQLPIQIVDDYVALKSPVYQKEVAYIHARICYGTPIQIYRYQQGQKKIIPMFREEIIRDVVIPTLEAEIVVELPEEIIIADLLNQRDKEEKEIVDQHPSTQDKFAKYAISSQYKLMNTNQCIIHVMGVIKDTIMETNINFENSFKEEFGGSMFIQTDLFYDFLKQRIPGLDDLMLFTVINLFDYHKEGYLRLKDFTDSYKDYCMQEPRLTVDLSKYMRRLCHLIKDHGQDPISFIQDLFNQTEFGFLSTHELEEKLNSLGADKSEIQFFTIWTDPQRESQISLQQLNLWILEFINQGYISLKRPFQEVWFCEAIIRDFGEQIKKSKLIVDYPYNRKSSDTLISIRSLIDLFAKVDISTSFWRTFCLIRFLKHKNHETDLKEFQISFTLIHKFIEENVKKPDSPQKIIIKPDQPEENRQEDYIMPNIQAEEKPQKYLVHHFDIELLEIDNLVLPEILEGQIFKLEFQYPMCAQKVVSYPFSYSEDQVKYPLVSQSTYTYVQKFNQDSIPQELVENIDGGIKFILIGQDKTVGQGIFTSHELVQIMRNTGIYDSAQEGQFKKKKIINLNINSSTSISNSKLCVNFAYSVKLFTQIDLNQNQNLLNQHNQTQVSVHLAKKVYMKLECSYQVNQRMKTYNQLDQDKTYSMQIVWVDKQLQSEQRLENINEEIKTPHDTTFKTINKEFKINVTDHFVKHIQTSNFQIEILSKDDYHLPFTVLGSCKIEMVTLLRDKDNQKPKEITLMDSRGLFIGVIKFKATLNSYPSTIHQMAEVVAPPSNKKKQVEQDYMWENPEIYDNFRKTLEDLNVDYKKTVLHKSNDIDRIRNILQSDQKNFMDQFNHSESSSDYY